MVTLTSGSGHRFLIVLGNIVVAEDLRELLAMTPNSTVDVRRSLDEAWYGHYDVAIFAAPLDVLLSDPRVRQMHGQGVRIVVLNSDIPATAFAGTGLFALPLPFRTDDVVALMLEWGFRLPPYS